jgi:hypothetical protein
MRGRSLEIQRRAFQEEPKVEIRISPKSESRRDRPKVIAVVTWGKGACVCIVVLGNHKDLKSHFDLVS